jgi:fructose-1,6-bisphosphatase/inositol monophosphatase family enzyme
VDTLAVLSLIQDVADRVITPRFRDLTAGQVAEKNPGDLVTVADHEAEVLLTQALRAAYPDAVMLGEEAHASDPGLLAAFRRADHAFTIDPVDGTKNFVHGSPDHAVMVAEVRAGSTVRAWLWQPQHEAAYVAERGAGAQRNGLPLTREPASRVLADLRVRTSRRAWLGRAPGGLGPLELTWVCCGVDYPKVVEGAADAVLYGGTHPWDHAPGGLLLTEAGGFLGTFDGAAYAPQVPARALVAAADEDTYRSVLEALADLEDAPSLRR